MVFLSVLITALLAGIVQGVTGFGGGIITMLVFPHFFGITLGAGITGSLGIALCASVAYRYRKELSVKMAVFPAFLYLVVCSLVISYSMAVDPAIIKKVFGVFLVLLSAYYLFISKTVQNRKLSLAVSIACIAISAACDGLFGIGGPLMVLYFMSMTTSTHAYLGTIQLFFWINSIYNTAFRFYKGILLPEHLIFIAFGVVGILAGGAIAGKIVDKLNADAMRKVIYVMIGVSGVINLIG